MEPDEPVRQDVEVKDWVWELLGIESKLWSFPRGWIERKMNTAGVLAEGVDYDLATDEPVADEPAIVRADEPHTVPRGPHGD